MAIESASISPQGAPQVVDTVAAGSKKANKSQAEAIEPKANAKFVTRKSQGRNRSTTFDFS